MIPNVGTDMSQKNTSTPASKPGKGLPALILAVLLITSLLAACTPTADDATSQDTTTSQQTDSPDTADTAESTPVETAAEAENKDSETETETDKPAEQPTTATATDTETEATDTKETETEQESVTVKLIDHDPSERDTTVEVTLKELPHTKGTETSERVGTAEGPALSATEQDEILERVPELETETQDTTGFKKPEETLPPPRPGQTVEHSFPNPDITTPDTPTDTDTDTDSADKGLRVLRSQPEGEVAIAPFISVTFDQPMIPVSTLAAIQAQDLEIEIEPKIEGRWVWLGTRTARFIYEDNTTKRLPGATDYTVTVPAGIKATSGAELAETYTYKFSTPPVHVTKSHVETPSVLSPLWFFEFDQRVDSNHIAEHAELTQNGKTTRLIVATETDIADHAEIEALTQNALAGRSVVLKPETPLSADTKFVITMPPGMESQEGPKKTEEPTEFIGATFAAFRVADHSCPTETQPCLPASQLYIGFNNTINTDTFDADDITIEPEIANLDINVFGDSISLNGNIEARNTYKVTFGNKLQDRFGQRLEPTELNFYIGDAEPGLIAPHGLITLDPMLDDGTFFVRSINNEALNITIYKVDPLKDMATFEDRHYEIAQRRYDPEWPIYTEGTIDIAEATSETATSGADDQATANKYLEVPIDLADQLENHNHLAVRIEVAGASADDQNWQNQPRLVWVQRTKYAIDTFSDHGGSTRVWVTSLLTGEPIENAEVESNTGATAVTNAEGIAEIEHGPGQTRNIVATIDNEIVAAQPIWESASSHQASRYTWYTLSDRGIYRPGETVRIKGWIREVGARPAELSLAEVDEIEIIVHDAFGNEISTGTSKLSPVAGFDYRFDLLSNVTLGAASLNIVAKADGKPLSSHWQEIQVQEFRRPEFQVVTEIDNTKTHYIGDELKIGTEAHYYTGGPLIASKTQWHVTAAPSSYSPPAWAEYTFGIWTPWWNPYPLHAYDANRIAHPPTYSRGDYGSGGGGYGGGGYDSYAPGTGQGPGRIETLTDTTGKSAISALFSTEGLIRPLRIEAHATVIDLNRTPVSNSASVLSHPSSLYIGLRTERTFTKAGEELEIDWIVTDIDGTLTEPAALSITAEHVKHVFTKGVWQEETTELANCDTQTDSLKSRSSCTMKLDKAGTYRIVAVVADEQGRENLTELTRWVAGGTDTAPSRTIDLENVTLVPDAKTYKPGDTAEILVQAPFNQAHGVLITTRFGIDTVEEIEFDTTGTAVLEIPITEDDIPGFGIQIEIAGNTPRENADLERPAYASGALTVEVERDSRRLDVAVAARSNTLLPGSTAAIDVAVRDADGIAVEGAEMVIYMVDEAVLALTDYELADPLEAFYRTDNTYISARYGRSSVILGDTKILTDEMSGADEAVEEAAMSTAESAAAPALGRSAMSMELSKSENENMAKDAVGGGQGSDAAPAGDPISLRTNFDAVAVFAPEVVTDANGRATIELELPDNLTRYRIMVVAADATGTQAGTDEANVDAKLPIMVRPAPPRFANFGDRFQFPVIVENTTNRDREVKVVLRTSNLVLKAPAGTKPGEALGAGTDTDSATITVPANDRVEVRFDTQTASAGTARYQVVALSDDGVHADAAEGHFPVYTPATTEAFATYGVVESEVLAQPVQRPEAVFPQFGGLELTTSSTAVASLTDAVIYLDQYRYENADGYASRIIGLVSLGDIWDAFETQDMPTQAERDERITADLTSLARLQNPNGGFRFWSGSLRSNPYVSVYVTNALVAAKQAGHDVNEETLLNALWYLVNIENDYPEWYSQRTKDTISAYALHVRHLNGDRDTEKAARLWSQSKATTSLEAAAWLWPTLQETKAGSEIETLLANRVTDSAKGATFVTDYQDQGYVLLHSNRRTDAVVLDALMQVDPESDLVVKTVTALLAARGQQGHWATSQENAFVLMAGSKYFSTFEADNPDFLARIWLGNDYVAEHDHRRRSTDHNNTTVPMDYLVGSFGSGTERDLNIERDGTTGRLYYRIGMKYAPKELNLEALDHGFEVIRTYESVDGSDDVVQNDDGSYTIKAGAKVRVRLTMLSPQRRTHVALIDPFAAGLEALNPALATTEPIFSDPAAKPGPWWFSWFEHQNLRDDRAEAFTTWLYAGNYEYSYVMRAQTPGEYIVPPAKAEEIYSPETFGRSSSDKVTVIDAESVDD